MLTMQTLYKTHVEKKEQRIYLLEFQYLINCAFNSETCITLYSFHMTLLNSMHIFYILDMYDKSATENFYS